MFEILGFLIGATIFFILSQKYGEHKNKRDSILSNLIMSILGGALGFVLAFIICVFSVVKTDFVAKEELYSSNKIIALADNSNVSGHFFLGSGSVGQEEYYVYYTETPRGYKQEKVRADSVYIKYISDNEYPHIEYFSKVNQEILTKKPNNAWFSIVFYLGYKNIDVGCVISEGSPQYSHTIIYIPEGSIQENYTIDLE